MVLNPKRGRGGRAQRQRPRQAGPELPNEASPAKQPPEAGSTMPVGFEGSVWKDVVSSGSSYAQLGGALPGHAQQGLVSVSDRVVAAATAAAATAAAAAAARAEAVAETARKYLQSWVVIEEYSRWRQSDKEEQSAWAGRGERIFREHLLPYVPSELSPAVAAAEADGALTGSGTSSSRPSVPLSTPTSTNRLAALFGGGSPSNASTAASTHHPWTCIQVKEQLKDEIWSGVPDNMRCCVWLHANDALLHQKLQPKLYAQVLEQAFGPPPFPDSLPGRCPTFSGGLLGLEEDVCGVQTTLKHLDLDGDAPLATWRSAPDESHPRTPHGPERPRWGLRMRLPHPSYPAVLSPLSKKPGMLAAVSRSPGRNPLGQFVRPEFNFWPDTYISQQKEEELLLKRQASSPLELPPPLLRPPLPQQEQPKHQHHHQQQQQPEGEQQQAVRRASVGGGSLQELLSYVGPDGRPAASNPQGAPLRLLEGSEGLPVQEFSTKALGERTSQVQWPQGLLLHERSAGMSGPSSMSQAAAVEGRAQRVLASRGGKDSGGPPPQQFKCHEGSCREGLRALARRSSSLDISSRRHHSATGHESRMSRGDTAVALGLFGRARPEEVALFSSYMKDRHLQAKRQAEQMKESTERSRDRVAFEAAAAAVMAAAKAVGNEQDELTFRRYYTSNSFDLTQKGLWRHRKPGRRGASESQLIKWGGPPIGGGPAASQEAPQGPTKSFVAFLKRKAGKAKPQNPPLSFSQGHRLADPGTEFGLGGEGGHSFEALCAESSPASGSPAIWVTTTDSPKSGQQREGRQLVPASGRERGASDRRSVVGWLQHAARSSSEACINTVFGRRRSCTDTPSASLVAAEGFPHPPRQPVRKKSLLNRLLPQAMLCRTPKSKKSQQRQRLDFLSNAMRTGGDPFETNRLAVAAARAAVKDVRRRSSSSTFSDEVFHSAKDAATAAAAAAAANFPLFRSPGLQALPENEGCDSQNSSSPNGRKQQQQQQKNHQLSQPLMLHDQYELPPMKEEHQHTVRLCVVPTPPPQHAEGGPQDDCMLPGCSPGMPDPQARQSVLLLPPLPPNAVDYYEQQQQKKEAAEESPPLSEDSGSWRGKPEGAPSTDVYFLEDVTDFTRLLTSQGQTAARRLLWSLFTFFQSGLEFCPVGCEAPRVAFFEIIPHLACILLLYMSEPAAFAVLYCLVKKAQEKDKEHRLEHVAIKRKDYIWLVSSVVEAIRFKFPRLFIHMRHLGVDVAAWTARGLQDAFSRMLPFDFVLRIMGAVLFEGSMALCRYCLALVQLLEPELMACETDEEAERVLYRCSSDPCLDLNLLTTTALGMKASMWRLVGEGASGLQSPYLMSTKIHEFIIVRPTDTSKIMSSDMWERLWRWLPSIYRYSTPSRLFSTAHDGITLTALLAKTEATKGLPMIFIAATKADEVFGFFSPFPITSWKPPTSASLDGAFVFTLKPRERVYWWTGKNAVFSRVHREGIYVGSDDVALYLDADLDCGRSRPSASFDSEQLAGDEWGDFRTFCAEVWAVL